MEGAVSRFYDYERLDFRFEDRDALIVFPKGKDGAKNGRWMVKTEYFGAFPNLELELLSRGWCLAYLRNVNRWGTDADSDAKARFCAFVSREFGLENRFACVGMSCGGLCAINFAAKYPDLVSVLYLDAPVVNLLSCPMGFGVGEPLGEGDAGWREIRDAIGFRDISELLVWRGHPLDKLGILAEHRIPVALVYGDADVTVPYRENGIVLEKLYRERGLPLLCAGKPGCGHHPHGLENPKPLADFIEAWTGE
ncbi:MAG: alpha/beta hydrolase [Clostridia bacterium]|nr:alpha/beta hydrolase [Clostridia bacterium]